ncbi:MAG: hypothetical protein ACFBZ8_04015 [Opitutales bacterium]
MKDPYRSPQIEDGKHNLILQNRAGNRCTLLVYPDRSELEFVYKPNAFRRKEFRARNFSNRDNQTTLFRSFVLPDLKADDAAFHFDYDPFLTGIELAHANAARNQLRLLNLAEENVFALCARGPLLLAIKPHTAFEARDGLLLERFEDRGEAIVSFIAFPGYELNRYRVLNDGTHILQVLENEPVYIGGEENLAQVERVLRLLVGKDFDTVAEANAAALQTQLRTGQAELTQNDFQRVFDLNRRIAWSGLDAGGACFGALNRIYYLIWVRDGSMTTAHMALAGNPEFARIWVPFLWANPSWTQPDDSPAFPEFGQMLGTRWSKSEDDGLFYAVWSLFTYLRVVGEDRILSDEVLDLMEHVIDRHLDKCWNADLQLMTSDTLGEESLQGSPYFSFDIVNGSLQRAHSNTAYAGKIFERVASYYHQSNTYNVLLMAAVLLELGGRENSPAERYLARARALQQSVQEKLIDPEGLPYPMHVFYTDGTDERLPLDPDTSDMWEYAWALSQGPFHLLPEDQITAGLEVIRRWPLRQARSYGLSPWNVLTRYLHETKVFSAAEAQAHLQDEVTEALTPTQKYPLLGALHEDYRNPDGWRALPFTAGSFIVSQTARLLAPLAQGLAVREGGDTRALRDFRYRLSRLDVSTLGDGDEVASWTLNGLEILHTLQLPEQRLRPGLNRIVVTRGTQVSTRARLRRSDAELLTVDTASEKPVWHFRSAAPMRLEFEGVSKDWQPALLDAENATVAYTLEPLERIGGVRLHIEQPGEYRLRA